MTNLTKTLLALSVAGFAIGFTTDVLWGFGKPAGAIFLGLFMLSKMLEKEVASFDAEETQRLIRADNCNAVNSDDRNQHRNEPLRAAA